MSKKARSTSALAGCAAVSAVQVGHWADTESLFRHTCGATRENGWAHRILGTALSEKGRLDEAVHELGIALRQWPDDPAAHNNLGVALARLGRPEEALREYREAVRLDPGEPDYRANLGGALLKSGQVAGAIAEFREAVRLQPGSAAAHANLGRALALDGRFDEAIEELRESLRLQPDEAAVQHALGVALERRGDVGPAIDALRAALRLEPDSAEILTELAELLATCPDPARRDGVEAVRLAERARQIGGDSGFVLDTLAAAYAAAGRFDEAIETAERALRLASSSNEQALAAAVARRLELYRRGEAVGAGPSPPGAPRH